MRDFRSVRRRMFFSCTFYYWYNDVSEVCYLRHHHHTKKLLINVFIRIKALYADRPNSPLVIFTLLVLLTEIVTYSWFLVHSQGPLPPSHSPNIPTNMWDWLLLTNTAVKHNKGVFGQPTLFPRVSRPGADILSLHKHAH